MENDALKAGFHVMKISQYPVPAEKVREFAKLCKEILIVEDGQPFLEEQVRGILGGDYTIKGRLTGALPRTGELNPDHVAVALGMKKYPCFLDSGGNCAETTCTVSGLWAQGCLYCPQ